MVARVFLIAGLGFGDEGKGSIVDYLARREKASLVVRYNGGCQAGHNVVTPDGRHHCFSQFGAGTFAGAETYLSRFMIVNPLFLFSEARHLWEVGISDCFEKLILDEEALVTDPFQVAMNRLRELSRGEGRHGSCGMGINETVTDAEVVDNPLRVKDLQNPMVLLEKLQRSQKLKQQQVEGLQLPDIPQVKVEHSIIVDPTLAKDLIGLYTGLTHRVRIVDGEYLQDRLDGEGTIIFEGAQGVLLDEEYGFFPYVTRSKTTFDNADILLKEYLGKPRHIGVTRAYMTRHGPGPFVTEDSGQICEGDHNQWGPWQRSFRTGNFDFLMFRYALDVAHGSDEIALTCLDNRTQSQVCGSYEVEAQIVHEIPFKTLQGQELTQWLAKARPRYERWDLEVFERLVSLEGIPVTIKSYGPTAEDKKDEKE